MLAIIVQFLIFYGIPIAFVVAGVVHLSTDRN